MVTPIQLWDKYQGSLFKIMEALLMDLYEPRLPLPEEARESIQTQITNQGLNFEDYNITTEDGYILNLWHVWNPAISQKKVAFMQHGLIDIAGTWFFNTPEKSIAHQLANMGYDVWLGNNRGTVFSYRHVNLTVKDDEYWDFSFHEMGKYDVPANVDFILQKTGVEKLTYVGHS